MNTQNLTNEELDKMIAEKYGENWTFDTVDFEDELIKEFIDRISTSGNARH
ncbi:MAG: hypothetical protein K5771_03090 [Oscillospiraceae bacterium]|nr:hypothetical protein [Oscillospiraceae bacterium]